MGRAFVYVILMLCCINAFGQVQQGIVKTPGRLMVDGLYKPGHPISDAVISIKNGNNYISNSEGEFAFSVPERGSYRISRVKKEGFQLTDQDFILCDKVFTETPIFILLESEEEWLNYRRSIERIVRTNYQNKLYEKQDELEKLRLDNKISKEQLKQKQIEIDEAWDKADEYIKNMSSRYLQLDYDYEDSYYRQIGIHILNGDLERADSMLRAKGNVVDRIEKGVSFKKAIDKYNEETIKICDYKCDILTQSNNKDSVAFYLELKASLDRENIEWQIQAAQYRAFALNDTNTGLNIIEDVLNTCNLHHTLRHNLPRLYCIKGDIYRVEYMYEEAMSCYESAMISYLTQNNETKYLNTFKTKGYVPFSKWSKTKPELMPIYIGMANCLAKLSVRHKGYNGKYIGIHGTNYAFDLYCLATMICENIYGEYSSETAECYFEFADWLCYIESFSHAKKKCEKIIEILNRIDHDNYLLASTYLLLGKIYSNDGKFKDALKYAHKSHEIYLDNENNQKYNDVYNVLELLGLIHLEKKEFSLAIDYYTAAIESKSKKYGENSIKMATLYNNIGFVYGNYGYKEKALVFLEKSYDLRLLYLGEDNYDTRISKENIEYVKKHIKD